MKKLFWQKCAMRRHWRFFIASLLCLPFVSMLLVYFVAWGVAELSPNYPDFLDFLWAPLWFALYWLSQFPLTALAVLVLISISIIVAWLQESKSTSEIVTLSIYSVVTVLWILFVLWALATHPGVPF